MDTTLKNSYYIVGTDTDIGKTYISSLLFKSLNLYYKNSTSYLKPIESGSKEASQDASFLSQFSGIPYDKNMSIYRFSSALSPHLASELDEVRIDLSYLKEEIKRRLNSSINFVEAAGGIYVPILRNTYYTYDLIHDLNYPVILVTTTKVGCINHTMLTIEFLRSKNIPIHGIVFNKYSSKSYEDDNIRVIKECSGISNILIVSENENILSKDKIDAFFGCDNFE